MYNKKIPKSYIYSPSEEPMRPMRPPVRPINGYDRYERERILRPRRYAGPPERVVRGGMRGASRITRSSRDSWREYSMRGRSLREEVGLRGGRGGRSEYWGIRGRDVREWRSVPYGELGRRERNLRADVGYRGRGFSMRGMRGGRGIRSRGIPRGPRGYSPRIRRDEKTKKETSEEYQQYVKNLYEWEKKIKEQEKNLSKDDSLTTSTYPSIRPAGEILFGAAKKPTIVPVLPEKNSKVTKSETKDTSKEKSKRIKAFDYKSWDKFDVDKALEESDEEIPIKAKSVVKSDKDQQQTKPAPITSTPFNKPTSMSKQRQPDRKGKKTVRLEQAFQEKETGNAFFKNGNYTMAIVHYGKAMELDPKEAVYVINRAMAYLKLKKWENAESDCTSGLRLHPDNPKALWRRGIARRELGKLEEAKNDLQVALRLEPNDKAVKEELDKVLKAIELATPTKKDTAQTIEVPAPRRRLSIEEVNFDEDEIEKTDTKKDNENIPIKNPIVLSEKSAPKAPINVIEFERDWGIQRSDEDLYHYIKVIPPSSYSNLLSNLLDADYISRILVILKDFYLLHDTVEDIYNVLYNLSCVKRSNLVIGLLGKEDKKVLEVLFKALTESFKDTQNGVSKVTRENVLKLAEVYHVQDLE